MAGTAYSMHTVHSDVVRGLEPTQAARSELLGSPSAHSTQT